jgi:hypothetical protein
MWNGWDHNGQTVRALYDEDRKERKMNSFRQHAEYSNILDWNFRRSLSEVTLNAVL